jgi:hypothetical protein
MWPIIEHLSNFFIRNKKITNIIYQYKKSIYNLSNKAFEIEVRVIQLT